MRKGDERPTLRLVTCGCGTVLGVPADAPAEAFDCPECGRAVEVLPGARARAAS